MNNHSKANLSWSFQSRAIRKFRDAEENLHRMAKTLSSAREVLYKLDTPKEASDIEIRLMIKEINTALNYYNLFKED